MSHWKDVRNFARERCEYMIIGKDGKKKRCSLKSTPSSSYCHLHKHMMPHKPSKFHTR